MQRDTLMGYVSQFYTPQNLVISAAGNITHDQMVAMVQEKFANLPTDNDRVTPAANYQGGEFRNNKSLEQAHLMLGFEGISRLSDDYYTAQALATILGGGMSSRLFQEIRENRGLVYSIYAFHSGYMDDGLFGIYAGTGENDVSDLIPVTCAEILKTTHDLGDDEIARVKSQLKAGLLMGRECCGANFCYPFDGNRAGAALEARRL